MRQTLVVFFIGLVALASALPAYKYPQPVRQNFATGELVPAPVQPSFVAQHPLPVPAPQHVSIPAPVQQQSYVAPQQSYVAPQQQTYVAPQQQNFVASQQQSFVAPQTQNFFAPQSVQQPINSYIPPQQYQQFSQHSSSSQKTYQPAPQQKHTIVSKEIYIHSAPEEQDEEIQIGQQFENAPIRKNYRVVFIKAPSQNLKINAEAIKKAQAANEEKTVIYVLSKKPDIAEVHNQLQQVQSEQKTHKPEVYFIKYKTQEEAQRAQQEIQAQYDSLGGSTHISDEGIAPVRSVIGNVGLVTGNTGNSGLNNGNQVFNGLSGNGGSFSQGSQSYAQQNFQQSASSNSFSVVPNTKYLPAKITK